MTVEQIIKLKENRYNTLTSNGKENFGVLRKLAREIRNLKKKL